MEQKVRVFCKEVNKEISSAYKCIRKKCSYKSLQSRYNLSRIQTGVLKSDVMSRMKVTGTKVFDNNSTPMKCTCKVRNPRAVMTTK